MKPEGKVLLDLLQTMPRHDRLVTLRSIFDLSQADLADKVGKSRGAVSTWEAEPETGRCHEPGRKQRIRMGLIFGVPPHVFEDSWGAQPKMPYWKEGRPKPREYEEQVRRTEPVMPRGREVITPVEEPKPVPAGVKRIG